MARGVRAGRARCWAGDPAWVVAMSLITETVPFDQAAPVQKRYRSQDELDMRTAVELWGRTRWPGARQVHELVMNRGSVRADMAMIGTDHFVSIEIKSEYDTTERLMNQSGMFRLASPELWLVMHHRHVRDADMIRYLIPSIGVAQAVRHGAHQSGPFQIEVLHEAQQYVPLPEAMLSLCWVAELHDEAVRRRLWSGKAPSHAKLVRLLERLDPGEQIQAVCRQLRGRSALWRADPPVRVAA